MVQSITRMICLPHGILESPLPLPHLASWRKPALGSHTLGLTAKAILLLQHLNYEDFQNHLGLFHSVGRLRKGLEALAGALALNLPNAVSPLMQLLMLC